MHENEIINKCRYLAWCLITITRIVSFHTPRSWPAPEARLTDSNTVPCWITNNCIFCNWSNLLYYFTARILLYIMSVLQSDKEIGLLSFFGPVLFLWGTCYDYCIYLTVQNWKVHKMVLFKLRVLWNIGNPFPFSFRSNNYKVALHEDILRKCFYILLEKNSRNI
jgi:hypothetical protein